MAPKDGDILAPIEKAWKIDREKGYENQTLRPTRAHGVQNWTSNTGNVLKS